MKASTLLLLLFFHSLLSYALPLDSIGVEKKNGKVYIIHKVEAKESLYSIARKYGVKVDDIKRANPNVNAEELKTGQTILVPSKYSTESTANKESQSDKIHVVKKGESYFKISQKYKVDMDLIKKANQNKELKTGDKIKIPSPKAEAPKEKENNSVKKPTQTNEVSDGKQYKIHVVQAKETLYGISNKYKVSVDEIKKANPSLAEGLKTGMEIKIPIKGKTTETANNKKQTTTQQSTKNNKKTEPTGTPNTGKSNENKAEVEEKEKPKDPVQEVPVVTHVPETPSSQETVKSNGGFEKVEEKGMAELMESKEDSPKFQALHRTATVGTIIQVINAENGQKIFVRVIGRLEGGSTNTVIKLSQRAMDRLQAKGPKISVQLSYIP
ncbi:MAG: LysM peptidoglycan-binding domain-containing protein [Cytophagaceae bacterium]|jgi:LysM repeat protein|nr:LysM peptidoglycan-binding domain-containing protein [Cytophagaceae bacterium]